MNQHPTDERNEPSFEELLEQYSAPARGSFRRGDKVVGTVVEITSETVFVDFGGRSEGSVGAEELTDDQGQLTVKKGDRIELMVASFGAEGVFLTRGLKLKGGEAKAALRDAFEVGIPVEGTVKDVNPGGFDVEIGGVRTFCPVSQIDLAYVTEPKALVGITGTFRVIEYAEGGRRIVVSRRAVMEEEAEAARQELEAKLQPGAVVPGRVTRIESFGAFVDLGGLEGMVHVSELSRRRVENPGEVLAVGQAVEVAILRIQEEAGGKRRIGLSLKALEPDPWEEGLPFGEGEVIPGTVRRLQPFGAFVEVAPGVDGLVHVSEIAHERIRSPGQVLETGQEVRVRVLSIDPAARRVALSIKAVTGPQAEETGMGTWTPPPADRPSLGSVFGDALRKSLEKDEEPKK